MYSVLYVDDEEALLEIGQLFLGRSGDFRVLTSPSAKQALDTPSLMSCDVIVSDYQMPGMDGIAFLKAVRQRHGDIPFILFTGRGREEVVIEAINNGADFYIQKGGDPTAQFAELAHKIRQAMLRRQVERSLRDSERRLSDIIDFLPDATFAIDRSGHVIAWNRAIEDMTGIPAAAMLGRGDYEYAVPFYGSRHPLLIDLIDEPDERIAEAYSDIYRSGKSLIAETDLPHPKGHRISALAKACHLYNQEGEIIGAIESIRDISELVKTGQELKKSEERYRSIVNDQTEMIMRFTPGGEITFVNEAFRAYFAPTLDLGRIVGRKIQDVIQVGHYDMVKAFIRTLTRESPTGEIERDVTTLDGRTCWQRWTIRALFNSGDWPVEYQVVGRDITQQKRAEDALTESERRYRDIYQYALVGFFETTLAEGTIIACNQKFCEIFGFSTVGDVLGKDFRMLYENPGERAGICQVLREQGYIPDREVRFVNQQTGQPFWGRFSARLDRNKGILECIIIDITDNKRVEEEILFKNAVLLTQHETAPDGILIVDGAGRILDYNRKFVDIWGVPENLMVSMVDEPVLQFVGGKLADPEAFLSRVRYLYDHREEKSYEELLLSDGRILERFSSPMFGEGRRYYGRVWYFRDITERRVAEDTIQESRQMLAEAMDLAHLAGWTYDPGTAVFTFDDHYRDLLGIPAGRDPVNQMPLETYLKEHVLPDDRDTVVEEMDKAVRSADPGYVSHYEHRIICRDGEARHIIVRLGVSQDAGSGAVTVHGANQDITERKKTEDAIRTANRQLKLLADVTRHDLLNKIIIIFGYLDAAKAQSGDPRLDGYLGKIGSATEAIRSQIEFTRVYQDIGSREPRWVSLETVMPRSQVPAGILFQADVGKVSVFADPMIEKVFANLLDNSVRHGHRVTEIHVSLHTSETGLTVVWADNGVGVPQDEKKKIFLQGYGKNTGLGMFLAQEILFLTGITIRENGMPGEGARFEIAVPKGMYRDSG